MQEAKDFINGFRAAFAAHKTIFNEGVCFGLDIALANIEKEEQREQARKNNHQGHLWDSRPCNEADLRSNAKRTEGRSTKVE
jgi:hypothetical protein